MTMAIKVFHLFISKTIFMNRNEVNSEINRLQQSMQEDIITQKNSDCRNMNALTACTDY